jgi:hypothetical protein
MEKNEVSKIKEFTTYTWLDDGWLLKDEYFRQAGLAFAEIHSVLQLLMTSVRSSAINQGFYRICLEKMRAVNRDALLGKFNAYLILFTAKVSIVLYEFSNAIVYANKALVLGYT